MTEKSEYQREKDKKLRAERKFPTGKTVLLFVILAVQIAMIIAVCFYQPQPQDVIRRYDVTVEPKADGTLDILYSFVWEAKDPNEPLTWIEIGMANANYSVYAESFSGNIRSYDRQNYDGNVCLVLNLDRAYYGGEVLRFSFKVNQGRMLCKSGDGYCYEFVPGWFNETPVENYTFRWADNGQITAVNSDQRQGGYYIWSGSFDCGGYTQMVVHYGPESFAGSYVVPRQDFDDNGAYDALAEEKAGMIALVCVGVIVLLCVQVWAIDSVVSYHRGRGFLTGYGYHVHTYGRSNPHYIRARTRYHATHSSGGRGGGGRGCACACACACAGGGRAGCSQKDTYAPRKRA